MIKFLITPERFSEACSIIEYVNTLNGSEETIVRIAPRFIVDKDNKYLVEIVHDEDGDIVSYENLNTAFVEIGTVTPKRLEKLIDEFMEAAKAIVNPTNGKGSNKPSSTATAKPPPG